MPHREQLSKLRKGTRINKKSSKQEKALVVAVNRVQERLQQKFPGITLELQKQKKLRDIVSDLKTAFPNVPFARVLPNSSMRPDGGILYMVSRDKKIKCPILITEKKNQGTNAERAKQGKKPQSKGNAVERLGKNVIGLRAWLLREQIFPFVCFGDGCDFAKGSSINDRVVVVALFGKVNKENVLNEGPNMEFNRGSFYFREKEWSIKEMENRSFSVALKAVYHYFTKFGEEKFLAR